MGVMSYSVLIVEDEAQARDYLVRSINAHPQLEVAAAVGTFNEGQSALGETPPDVLLTDLGLPDGNGIDLIKLISARRLDTEAMVVTVFGDERHVVEALEAGAHGYLIKDDPSSRLAESVLEMLNGGSPISPAIAKYLLKRFQPSPPSNDDRQLEHLTKREHEVLQLVAKGYTSAEIGGLLTISHHTVISHVKHIYRKLAVNSRAQAIFEASRLGLVDSV